MTDFAMPTPIRTTALRRADYGFLAAIALIVVFGLVMLASATGPTAVQKFGDAFHFLKRQALVGILPGAVLFMICSRLSVERMKQLAPLAFWGSMILLGLGFIPGLRADYGSGSWISLAGFSFQPSELAKLGLILYFAWWLDRRKAADLKGFWSGFLPFMVVVGIVVAMMMAQSDLGTTAVILAILFAMYVSAGAPFSHMAALAAAATALFLVFIKIAPYRADRLKIFLRPDLDPQGVGYHVNQALLAVGSGGWFGLGLGKSRQKFSYLPEVSADSIFAIIAEEMGFFIAAGLIVLFVFVLWRGLKIAERASDPFGTYAAVGISVWIGFQAFLNISAMLGLMPLTGVPLPFISHGGSAMMSLLAAVGIMVAISKTARAH